MRLRVTFASWGDIENEMPNAVAVTDEYMEDEHGDIPDWYLKAAKKGTGDAENGSRECFIYIPDEQVRALWETPRILSMIERTET